MSSVIELQTEFPEWAEYLFRPQRYKTVYGGRGAARSWSFAKALLLLGAQKPMRILCAREFQRSIADSVHRLLQDRIAEMQLPGYTVTQRTIEHANGTIFLFEGLRYNITKIKSLEGIDVCWVEEAEKVSKDSWDVLIPTIRKEGSEIWISFNPDLEDDPTYQRFVVNHPKHSPPLKVSWRDNPFFYRTTMPDERDYLFEVDPDAADWVWEGNPRKSSDAQILRGKWHVSHFEPEKHWQGPYHGLDFGFANDPLALTQCYIHRINNLRQRLYIRREVYKRHLEQDHMPREFNSVIKGIGKYRIIADSARPETISYLTRHGLPKVVPVYKWHGSIEDGISYLRSFEEIIIHPECPGHAQEAKLYSYKVDRVTGEVLTIIVDKWNNTWDAVRYALSPIIRAARLKSTYKGRQQRG